MLRRQLLLPRLVIKVINNCWKEVRAVKNQLPSFLYCLNYFHVNSKCDPAHWFKNNWMNRNKMKFNCPEVFLFKCWLRLSSHAASKILWTAEKEIIWTSRCIVIVHCQLFIMVRSREHNFKALVSQRFSS